MTETVESTFSQINYNNNSNNNILVNDNQEKVSNGESVCHITNVTILTSTSSSAGYYDADKCRAYISNQIKVNKIDRFALQISGASDVESNNQLRLEKLMNMFTKCSSKVIHDFTMRCKLGLQSHTQDRILNYKRKKAPSMKVNKSKQNGNIHKLTKLSKCNEQRYYYSTISNDLLYGVGAQLVRALLSSETIPIDTLMTKRKCLPSVIDSVIKTEEIYQKDGNVRSTLSEDDYLLTDSFEPKLFVKKIEDLLKTNLNQSKTINKKLSKISQLFESLALKHRNKVDKVYAAEEERQASSITRRSSYNLSVAAIKATSTPVHINGNTYV